MSITYTRKGDYEIPDLAIPENKIQVEGKYAMMRLRYLKENKKSLYTTLLMSNQLPEHLMNIQEVAMERVEQIVSEMKANETICHETITKLERKGKKKAHDYYGRKTGGKKC